MAAGDLITSARFAGLFRRINRLENLHSYTVGASSSSAVLGSGFFAAGPSGNVYYPVSGNGIKKNNGTLTSESAFIADGSSSGQVSTASSVFLAYNEVSDVLFVADPVGTPQGRMQAFDGTSGSLLWGYSASGSNQRYQADFAALDDGTCVAYCADNNKLYKFSDSGTRTELIDFSSLPVFVWRVKQWSADQFVLSYWDTSGGTTKAQVYDSDGTLDQEFESGWSTADFADTFEMPLSVPVNGVIVGSALASNLSPANAYLFRTTGKCIKSIDGDLAYDAYITTQLMYDGSILATVRPSGSGKVWRWTEGSSQTTWYHYPDPGSDSSKVSLGTPDFGLTVPADNALQNKAPHWYQLRDMRNAIESVATNYYGAITTGTTTSTTANKLVDSGASFSGQVFVGDIVVNTTDSTTTTVSAVDSGTQLSLGSNIFTTGEDYEIRGAIDLTATSSHNLFTLAIDSAQDDWSTVDGDIGHEALIYDEYLTEIETVLTYLEGAWLS